MPDWHREADRRAIEDGSSPMHAHVPIFLKTHELPANDFRRVVYLAREGRDTLAAYYYFLNGRSRELVSLEAVIRGQTPHGSWNRHVVEWMNRRRGQMLLVKYEDLLKGPMAGLKRVLEFTGLDAPVSALERAVELSSFRRMQEMERNTGLFDGPAPATLKSPFIRRGEPGTWRELFDEKHERLFWELNRPAMDLLGYGQN